MGEQQAFSFIKVHTLTHYIVYTRSHTKTCVCNIYNHDFIYVHVEGLRIHISSVLHILKSKINLTKCVLRVHKIQHFPEGTCPQIYFSKQIL